jgi:dolichyl-diphosphooligosaccharide--protein glycosyltransferase
MNIVLELNFNLDYSFYLGIANRTTLADGNTWNHEHIATIGYMMASPADHSYELVRHIADYVLVWRDDLGKSPHMARIGIINK